MSDSSRGDQDPSSPPALPVTVASTLRAAPPSSGAEDTQLSPGGPSGHRPGVVGPALATVDPQRYVIRQELARGGMGRISVADDRALGRQVAIKEVLLAGPDYEARFQRELALTARLQHPGIVTIHDGGLWPNGALVYIMRLVSGESLEVRSGRCRTVEERIALLPNAIAAVDALAYAHSQGIIHRDVKPANIMVGDFGETVVIDWGLAKEMRVASVAAPSSPSSSANSAADTVVGDVIGTPAYMPPEQARGKEVDERADVYALGAVLYHVLSGSPPYRGRSTDAMTAVLAGPPPPLGDLAPGIPRELLAIVARAMSTDPADRYPSAAELGTELKRFQNGQLVAAHQYTVWELARRWVRKRRATVAVAAIALLALAAVAIVSVRRIVREEERAQAALALAEHHHAEAERRSAEAERLVDFMIFKLHDKLQPIGRLDVLEDVAQTMQAYYAGRTDAKTPEDQRKRARARRNLGNVLVGKGDTSAALVEQQAALANLVPLTEAAPGDRDLAAELAESYLAVGRLRVAKGQLGEADDMDRRALAIATRLYGEAATEPRWRRLLINADTEMGGLQDTRGDLKAALVSYRAALALAGDLNAESSQSLPNAGSSASADVDLALVSRAHDNVGDVLVQQGDAKAALVEFRAALALDTADVARHPGAPDRQSHLALGYLKVGDLLRDTESEGALAMYRSALELTRGLVAHDPENAVWLRDLSTCHVRIGDLLAAPDTAAAALAAYRAANQIRIQLTTKDPANAEWQRDLVVSSIKVGTILEGTDQLAGALASYEHARVIAEKLAAATPNLATAHRDLVFIYTSLARVGELQHDLDGALRWLRAAVASSEQVITQDPKNVKPDDYIALYYARELIGDVLVDQRQLAAADAAYAQAQAVAEKRIVEDSTNPLWKTKLDKLRTTRAHCCRPH